MGNSIFFPKKRDILYDTAISATKSIAKLIKLSGQGSSNVEVDKNAFHKVFSNDPNSPTIYFLSDYEYIIYYPPFSSKYTHGYDDKCKFIQVLKGVVYEEKTGRKIFKGDKIKVSPSDNYTPYTEAEEAYLRVCVGDCKSLFEQVCT
jgi:hypothetical protein